ncbi:MAG TPA: SMI1/KNR4 family protein [Longimicrobium sp.]
MTPDARIAEIGDMLRQLRAADTGLRVFGAPAHGYRLHPPLSGGELRAFEATHGITLPEDYRLFLREIGNGGPGPAYGLETLAAAAEGCRPGIPFPFVQVPSDDAEGLLDHWLDDYPGVLSICHHGCAIYSYLVVNGPAWGTIWDGDSAPQPAEVGFADWYWRWADQSLRRLRSERMAGALRVGMSTGEVTDAVEAAWKKRTSVDGITTYFEAPGIPAQLEVDEHDRVVKITPGCSCDAHDGVRRASSAVRGAR